MTSILAIDQGTTSSRAILFDDRLTPRSQSQQEFPQHFPGSGWVEHDPADIWTSTVATARAAVERAGTDHIVAIGITNQRETVVVWDRETGETAGNAIVWQDRRTSDDCERYRRDGHDAMIARKTGLLLDPYFSATKLAWILDNVDGARSRAEAGKLLFGTVDTFLVWQLTGKARHVTDATNASRTMLYNIETCDWDDDLLDLFRIPRSMLPEVLDSAAEFGTTHPSILGKSIPVRGVAGDQQAAAIGQGCFDPGMVKATYGTGCFALLNTGKVRVASQNRLLTTIAYSLDGTPTYALEGSIFIAGAVVQWLRDGIGIIRKAEESGDLAATAEDRERLYLVPAFTGLGAPYWNADCRGAIYGLVRDSNRADFARAALESVAFQTRDLVEAMKSDWPSMKSTRLRVDGGMAASNWTMQAIANQLCSAVDRPVVTETTALGAAYLAGLQSGICPEPHEFANIWRLDRRFEPVSDVVDTDSAYAGWKDAIARTL